MLQGDRKAGLSLHSFNYESQWGQKALKTLYRIIVGVSNADLNSMFHCD